jgi:uncharacterized membrane protein
MNDTNYNWMIGLGVILILVGGALVNVSATPILLILGIVFLIIGLTNREKTRKESTK